MTNTISTIILICSLITSIAAVVAVFKAIYGSATAPNKAQDKRIELLEGKVEVIEQKLDADYKRLNMIEEQYKICLQAILALLSHEINGNSIDKLEKAKADIEAYLISR